MYRGLCSCSNLHELQTYGNIKEDKHTFQLSIVLLINSIPSSCRPSISITCARACVAHVSLGTSSRPQNINTILITQQSVVRCSYCLEMNVTFAMGALIGILIRTLFFNAYTLGRVLTLYTLYQKLGTHWKEGARSNNYIWHLQKNSEHIQYMQ